MSILVVISIDVQVSWVACLQCAVLIPSMLRLFHYRWRMNQQIFLLSSFYLILQAFDISTNSTLSVSIHNSILRLTVESFIHISTIFLSFSCLSLATPPVYMGNVVTKQYLRVLMLLGTLVIDVPSSVLKTFIISSTRTNASDLSHVFLYVTFLKNIMVVVYVVFRKIKMILDGHGRYDNFNDSPLIETADTRDVYYDEEDCV